MEKGIYMKIKRLKLTGSINQKLISVFSLLILVMVLILGVATVFIVRNELVNNAFYNLEEIAVSESKYVSTTIQGELNYIDALAQNTFATNGQIPLNQRINFFEAEAKRKGYDFFAIADGNGKATIFTSGQQINDVSDREFFQKAIDGEATVSDLIFSELDGKPVIIYATPMRVNNKVIGVFYGRKDGFILSDIARDIYYKETGAAYIINNQGITVGQDDTDIVLAQSNPIEDAETDKSFKNLAEVTLRMIEGERGFGEYTFGSDTKMVGFAPIEGSPWMMSLTVETREILEGINTLLIIFGILCLVIVVIGGIVVSIISSKISRPIISAVVATERIASLDMTQDIPEILLKRTDEVGKLGNAVQSLTHNLRAIIGQISLSSDQIYLTSEELTSASQQSATASEEVTRTAEEIARGAEEQARNTEEGSLQGVLLGESMEKDLGYMKELNLASHKVIEALNEGLIEIENLSAITDESNKATREILDMIVKTNESSNEIGQAGAVITSIAAQTNLLALNASIEAARAGDAGRGFAVVADEIRKLAEQSTASTKAIDAIVKELQNNASNAVKTMEEVSFIVDQQTNSVTSNKDKYHLISDYMKDAEQAIEKLNVSSKDMEAMKDIILDKLQNLSAIAQQNSAGTQQVTATMEEQTTSIQEIASASGNLTSQGENLQAIINRFKR